MSGDTDADNAAAPPRATVVLHGHEAAEATFTAAAASGRLAHAWLIVGPPGVGKATLSYRLAARMLAAPSKGAGDAPALFEDTAPDTSKLDEFHPAVRRVRSGSHPDLMTVTRTVAPGTSRLRRDIVVDDVRAIGRFLHMTPAEGGWRIVIVDTADELNNAAANALLKILEEPPPGVLLFLLSASPRRLLPTIRSRCRRLTLSPLESGAVGEVLRQIAPEASEEDRTLAARLSGGAPGRAAALLSGDGLSVFRDVSGYLARLPDLDIAAIHAFGDRVGRSGNEHLFAGAFDAMDWWIGRIIRGRAVAGSEAGELGGGADDARILALGRSRNLADWLDLWEKIARLRTRTEGANLDRKLAVISAFNTLQAMAR